MIRSDCFGFCEEKQCCLVLKSAVFYADGCEHCSFYKSYTDFLTDAESAHYNYLKRVIDPSDHYYVNGFIINEYDIVRLRALGKTIKDISSISGYNERQIRRVLKKYK